MTPDDLKPHLPIVRRPKHGGKVNAGAFARMIKAMQDKACSNQDLADETGLSPDTCRSYTKALVLQQAAHIESWGKDGLGRDTTARYRMGFGLNMPRSLKKTNKHRAASAKQDRYKAIRRVAQANQEAA